MTKLHSFEMWAYLKIMKISWREKKKNEEVLTLADEQLYIIPTIKKRKITNFGNMIRRNYIHRLLLEGPLEGKEAEEGRERSTSSLKYSMQIVGLQRKAKNGVDDKHHRMDGDAIRIPRETCSTGILRSKRAVHETNCNRRFFNGIWSINVSPITY